MSDVLHYPGDQTNFDPHHVMGPDLFGACYVATAAEYDAAADRTTLWVRPVPPAELQRIAGAHQ